MISTVRPSHSAARSSRKFPTLPAACARLSPFGNGSWMYRPLTASISTRGRPARSPYRHSCSPRPARSEPSHRRTQSQPSANSSAGPSRRLPRCSDPDSAFPVPPPPGFRAPKARRPVPRTPPPLRCPPSWRVSRTRSSPRQASSRTSPCIVKVVEVRRCLPTRGSLRGSPRKLAPGSPGLARIGFKLA